MNNILWRKYRPTKAADYIFQNDSVREAVTNFIEKQEFPHLLMVSGPGQGKSTLGEILISECGIDQNDVMKVNASSKNGIGFIRDELEPWMQKAAFSKFKVVRLEECNKLSNAAQTALLDLIEESSERVRFICTANYSHTLEKAFVSRMEVLDMNGVQFDDILAYVADVVEKEGLEIESEDALLSHIDMYSPDIRSILGSIQQCTSTKGVIGPAIGGINKSAEIEAWRALWTSKDFQEEKAFELSAMIDNNNYETFYQVMYENSAVFGDYEARAIVLLSDYLDKAQRSANQRLHLEAFLWYVFVIGREE